MHLREQLFRNRAHHRIVDTADRYFMFYKPDLLALPIKDAINEWRQQKGLA